MGSDQAGLLAGMSNTMMIVMSGRNTASRPHGNGLWPLPRAMDIVITYCEECNFTPWATSLRDALQERYGTTATRRDAGNGCCCGDVAGRRIDHEPET